MKSVATLLRSEKIILEGEHLDVRSLRYGDWRFTNWAMVGFKSPDYPDTTEIIIFPEIFNEIDHNEYEVSAGDLVKLAYESVRGKPHRIIHVIEGVKIRLNGAYIECWSKVDGIAQMERMHLSNPYLKDWLKGSRSTDGERKVA